MEILPAIDLLNGQCVRLVQGRYDRVLSYQRDPVEVAEQFRDKGARWLHVIDLDGARDGRPANLAALKRIAGTGLEIEFGGGVREEDTIQAALDAGATRVIIGTRALEDLDWFKAVVHQPRFMNKICLGLDARLGKLAVRGWTQDVELTAIDVAERVRDWPLSTIICTDIGRDGMLLGPNIDAIRQLAAASVVPIVASGGVTDLDDVLHLGQLNLVGVVVGRALYENTLDLAEALRVARKPDEIG